MFKQISSRLAFHFALLLSLTVFGAPTGRIFAQSTPKTTPSVVSGGDPQPTGEFKTPWITILSLLVAL